MWILELSFTRRHEQFGLGSFTVNSILDPVVEFVADAFIATKVNGTECLRSAQEGADVLDGGTDQASHRQIKVNKIRIVLDELLEAGYHL